MTNIFDIVKAYSIIIRNDRNLNSVFEHAVSEMVELDVEILKNEKNEQPGPDGIVGECVDVIACMIDIIVQHSPDLTESEFNSILTQKCEKWKQKYDSPGTKL